jgi:phosphatidylserine/phosphatidylglycerophosphate/cardiolipin synthase-like enzyme
MEALFSSHLGGEGLRDRVLQLIAEASVLARSRPVDLHIMTFSFTDQKIADLLAASAVQHPSMTVRVLADWSQRIRARGQQVGHLEKLNLPNLQVRYKNDQPYTWDPAGGRLRWSYHASRGLLHHKTLCVLVDKCPWKLACGSFNWTANATKSYENLLVLSAQQTGSRELISRIELEFEAMWSDGRATLAPEEADFHYKAILGEFRHDATVLPRDIVGWPHGKGERLRTLNPSWYPSSESETDSFNSQESPATIQKYVAFSARRPDETMAQRGYAELNRTQHFSLRKPSGRTKHVPLTITNLALDTIFRAASGDVLKIAMYGLSIRVPEYGAFLDAARRGVRLFVLLDGNVGAEVIGRFAIARLVEDLPIEVRAGRRMMHQKYVVNPNSCTVLTGTANMSTDSSTRHSEHCILVRGCPELAAQFNADFETMWGRLTLTRIP